MESETTGSLARRAKHGDVAAFEELVRRLGRRAVATAHLITGDLHAGEEAAQDAFLIAWRRIGQLREPEAFRGWFAMILSREAGRHRRRTPLPLEPGLDPAAPASAAGEEAGLPPVANRLKAKYRDVLALRYVEGLSYREIAAALGIPVARVKSRLHDGRELLRERLAQRRESRE
jgi:RNA polymerase sigma-70 factor (ECF subfamily)